MGSEDVEEGDDEERRIPTMSRIDRTMPFTIDTDKAVFTRRTHSIPSDGEGRFDRPIFALFKS